MRKIFLASALLCLLAACQKGEEYVGQWVGVKNECATLDIVQNGDQLMAKIREPNIFVGLYSQTTVPAVIKDGMLSVQMSKPVVMSIDKSSGELVGEKLRYRRPNGSEKKCDK